MSNPLGSIPGVVMSGSSNSEPPMLLVISPEKAGKSSLAISLINFPSEGKYPLVIAADASGPDSCANLGYPVPTLKIKEEPGETWYAKGLSAVAKLEQAARGGALKNFGSIVFDCWSTFGDRLFEDSRRMNPSRDPRQNYGQILEQLKTIFYRILDLNMPTVGLAWLKPAGQDPVTKRMELGGPAIVGSFRTHLAGKATHILFLEKSFIGKGAPNADAEGYTRVLHTKPYMQINCDGRLRLPEPCPPNLGYIMGLAIYGPQSGGVQ